MSIDVGQIIEGKITSITKFGAFVSFDENKSGMIHISEVSDSYVNDINDFLKVGQTVSARVSAIDEKGRISLSIKHLEEKKNEKSEKKTIALSDNFQASKPEKTDDFEEMMSKFLKCSNDKLSDLKKAMDPKKNSHGFSRKNGKKY